jgi:ABC-type dipeptide/oligopeptide/nickel transport system ATPase component
VSVQARVLDLIDERTAAAGAALLFISHDLAVVASLCDRLLVMWQGRIVERGSVVEVLTAPRHEHTRRLLADAELRAPDPGQQA